MTPLLKRAGPITSLSGGLATAGATLICLPAGAVSGVQLNAFIKEGIESWKKFSLPGKIIMPLIF
jgi:hypothetical protein